MNGDCVYRTLPAGELGGIERRLRAVPPTCSARKDAAALLSEVRLLQLVLALVLDELDAAALACQPDDQPVAFSLTRQGLDALRPTEVTG